MRHLGSRHALPVAEIRSRFGLRGKLMVVFTVLSAATAGLVALAVVSPPRAGPLGGWRRWRWGRRRWWGWCG